MFSSLQMPFLQALGYAIANSLWQIALLWLLVILLNTVIRQSSHIKYITALSAQVAGFVWFVTTLEFYYNHCRAASVEAEQLISQNGVLYHQNFLAGSDNILSFLVRAEETLPFLSIAYLLLLMYLVIKWIRNFQYTKQLSTIGLQSADATWQNFINEMTDRLDILQNVKIYVSSLVKSPLTIGYVKPIILVPFASLNHLTTEQLEAVLIHELAHIKRADYIINILISLVEIILFFNPFTRLIGRQIQKERENCCDDWVLHYQYNPNVYAEALLRIACLQKENSFAMNAVSNKKGELLQRVKRIVQPDEKMFNYKHQIAALFVITGLLFSIAWLQPNENRYLQGKNNIKEVKKQIVVTPLTAQIGNPFFSAASIFSKSLQEDVNKSLAQLDKTLVDSSLALTGIKQAQLALEKAKPVVVSTMSSGNWQKLMQEATRNAAKSVKQINWKQLQQSAPQLDSDLVINSVNEALSNKDFALQGALTGLDAAKEELEKLGQEKQLLKNSSISRDFLKLTLGAAFSSIKNINLNAITDSLERASAAVEKAIDMQNRLQHDNQMKAGEMIKKAKADFKKVADAKMQRRLLEAPLPPTPPPPPIGFAASLEKMPFNVSMFTTDTQENNKSDHEPASVSQFVATKKIASYAKTIHIVNTCDSSTINIIIEMKQ